VASIKGQAAELRVYIPAAANFFPINWCVDGAVDICSVCLPSGHT
jgi:hypothetical protein